MTQPGDRCEQECLTSELETNSHRGLRAVQWFTATWAVALACLCLARNHIWFYDDAYITLRYARHLAEGLGPVWNRAGAAVEGFSSPLHVLLVAGLLKLHVGPVAAVRGLGFASHALLIAFVWHFVRKTSGSVAAVVAASLIAASWPLLVWDLGGLDTVPFSALLTIGTLITLRYLDSGRRRDVLLGGILLGFALFMRPDGAVIAVIAFSACLLGGRQRPSLRAIAVLCGVALFTLVMLPWEIFRVAYFHAFLPNTYYDKIYGVPLLWRIHSGLQYLRAYVTKPPYLIPFLTIVLPISVFKRKICKLDLALCGCIAGYTLYLVDCGGDHMLGYRFITPVIPLLAIVLTRGLTQLGAWRKPAIAAVVSGVLLIACLRQTAQMLQNPDMGDPSALIGKDVGEYIDAHWPPGSMVALNVAGAPPYFADRLMYIDMLGLNDASIARRYPVPVDGPWVNLVGHLKGSGASVLERRPDFIILGGALGMPVGYTDVPFIGDYELIRLPGLALQYKPCVAEITLSAPAASYFSREGRPKPSALRYYQRRDLPYPCIPDR